MHHVLTDPLFIQLHQTYSFALIETHVTIEMGPVRTAVLSHIANILLSLKNKKRQWDNMDLHC